MTGITFGEKLRTIREKKGISIRQMHMVTGFARSTIREWEKGNCYPSSYQIILILANFFHVYPSYFLKDTVESLESPEKVIQEILSRLQRLEKIVDKEHLEQNDV